MVDNVAMKKYAPEIVYGGIDGTITTFSVIMGAIGIGLSPKIIFALGLANVLADGFSMASASYISAKTLDDPKAIQKSIFTLLAFVAFGMIPMICVGWRYYQKGVLHSNIITIVVLSTLLSLFLIGYYKGLVKKSIRENPIISDKNIEPPDDSSPFKSGMNTLVIGGIAAGLAFTVGRILR